MGREIKFRGWDQQAKDWNDKFSTKVGGEHNPLTEMCDWEMLQEYSMDVLVESQFEIMQFTGLKDCNGVEIYEGDIVKVDYETSKDQWISTDVIEFYEGSFGSRNKNGRLRIPALFMGEAIKGMNVNSYKVIGNIYQNPELIPK